MQLIFNNATTYQADAIAAAAVPLIPYVAEVAAVARAGGYTVPESSINLPVDDQLLQTVETLVMSLVTPTLRYIFVVGIGGSNLGTKAIYDAMFGYQDIAATNRPQLIFVDTTSATHLQFYIQQIISALQQSDEYLVFTISKSGGTTETLANTEILLAALHAQVGDPAPRTIVVTDEDSDFCRAAEHAGMQYLTIPPLVGGRYSVLTAVGLAPLLALGVDVAALRQGAADMRTSCLETEVAQNPAVQGAAFLAHARQAGYVIHDTFVFNSELESLGKWYRQLLGESIGKAHDVHGTVVHQGITPTVSVGSTDLHSVGQLYLGGPKDKVTAFVTSQVGSDTLVVPAERVFPGVVPMIDGQSPSSIMAAILGGVTVAYNDAELPFVEIQLAGSTPYELGAFMQYKMFETMYLGRLLAVNPFDQPNVESYKRITKSLLEA